MADESTLGRITRSDMAELRHEVTRLLEDLKWAEEETYAAFRTWDEVNDHLLDLLADRDAAGDLREFREYLDEVGASVRVAYDRLVNEGEGCAEAALAELDRVETIEDPVEEDEGEIGFGE
jgi:hypothetical protein